MALIRNRFYVDYSVYYWTSPDGGYQERHGQWEVRDRLLDNDRFGPIEVCPDEASCKSLARAMNDEWAPYGIGPGRRGKPLGRASV